MTSVQNHPLQLNGNSQLWIWLFLWIVIPGCSIFGPVKDQGKTGDVVTQKDDDKSVDATMKVDTIVWQRIPEEEIPPITSREEIRVSQFKETYRVVLIAPFEAGTFQYGSDPLKQRSKRMLQFYAGMKYGLQNHPAGDHIRLSIVDSRNSTDFAKRIRQIQELEEADVIIGPYFSQNLSIVADYAREKGKMLISPWNSGKVTNSNPYFVQLRPSLKSHCESIIGYAKAYYDSEEMMLICKNNIEDKTTLSFFQNANRKLEQDTTLAKIPELIIDDISSDELFEQLKILIEEDSVRAFLIPNWQDEPFVISVLSKLNFAKAENDLTVFGLPQWVLMNKMDYDYYENLNVHVSSAAPLSFNSEKARQIRNRFFEEYGDVPGSDTYYGVDVIHLVSFLLNKYGTNFTEGLENPIPPVYFHDFDFIQHYNDQESIDYFENIYVDILEFEDYRFQRVKD
jgi:hypothetical protein